MPRLAPHFLRSARVRLSAPLLLTVAFAGCSADPVAPPAAACSDQTQLTVTRGSTGPTMTWSPACAVSFVAIVRDEDFVMAWGIRTPTPSLTPPQQAYVAPDGAYELASRALRAGVPYTIILGVRDTNSVTGAIRERAVASVPYVP